MNMKNRIALLVGGGFLVIMLAGAHLFIHYLIMIEIESVKSRQREILDIITADISREYKYAKDYLKGLAGIIAPADFNSFSAAQNKLNGTTGERITLSIKNIFDYAIFMIDRNGRTMANYPYYPGLIGTDMSDRDYFKNAKTRNAEAVSLPIRGRRPPHNQVIIIAQPVKGIHSEFAGIVCGGVTLSRETILGSMIDYTFSNMGYFYIINSERILVMHPDPVRIGETVFAGTNHLLDRAIDAGFEGSGETVNSRGIPMITSFKRIRGTDMIIGANYYRDKLYSGIYSSHGFLYYIAAGASLIFFVILSFMLKVSFAPLYSLIHRLDEMKKSGAINTVKPAGSGEVRKLHLVFNSMAEKLNLSHEQIISLYSAKSQYLAKMSHEIRTPMNAIIGMTDLAMMTDDDFERHDYLTTVKQSSAHLIGVINDILDYSKIEAGAMVLDSVSFDPLEQIKNVKNIMSYKCAEKNITLSLEVSGCEEGCVVTGDPQRFRQVLFNIIGNSIKFTDKGRISVRVKGQFLDAEKDSHGRVKLLIEIEDSGIGIPAEKIDHIFDSFAQVDPDINRKFGGTGLGLTISREIVQRMNGSITVKSEEGRGSLFTVEVVFQLSEELPVAGHGASEKMNADPPPADKKYKVLVAEDNPVNVKLIETVLKKNGHEVVVAGNGREAVELLKQSHYDAVFMDIEMPVMDGLEASKLIRAGDAGAENVSIPIIAMTAHAFSEMKDRCLEAGMNSYVSKPVKIEEINSLLAELVEKS